MDLRSFSLRCGPAGRSAMSRRHSAKRLQPRGSLGIVASLIFREAKP